MTTGYIVKSGKYYLTKRYSWFQHKSESEAYVFPEWQIKDVLEMSEGWTVKPTHIIPAEYFDGVVTVTGEPMGRVEG